MGASAVRPYMAATSSNIDKVKIADAVKKKSIIRRFDIQRDRHVGPSSAALYRFCLERHCQVRNRQARARKKSSMHTFL